MKRIMTVDDSPSLRQMLVMTLEDAGFQVVEACDGKDALTKLRGETYNLIVTDLNMPEMDGIELTRQLRAMTQYRFVPILLLTTESDPEKKQAGKAAGASGWIVKPFRPEDLLATVKRVIR